MKLCYFRTRYRTAYVRHAQWANLSFVCVSLSLVLSGTAHAQIEEYDVKAAFLYKFGLFIKWPDSAFRSADSRVSLCIGGEDPFGETLDKVVAKEQINGRQIVIRRLKIVDPNPPCHILFVGGSEDQSRAEILEMVRGSAVLTVVDTPRHPSEAGIINFVIADQRVRFNIDDEAAAQNGLIISSKLSSLALNVKMRAANGE